MVKDKSFYRTLASIALPVAFQSFISLSVALMDNVMVGSLGEIKMSGVALANQVTIFLTFFIRGASGGASVLISQYWGKKDMARIKSVFGIVFQLCFAVTAIAVAIIHTFPGAVMGLFTNDQQIIAQGIEFIRIICFSYLLYCITDTMVGMLRCVEVVKVSLYIAIITLFVNTFFDYVLIYGKLGFPEMGVRGAATATVIARACELTFILCYIFLVDKRLRLKVRDLFVVERQLYHDFFRYGLPILFGDLQWGLVGTFKATIVGRMGPVMVAANSMTEVVLSLGAVFTSGLANAATVIIGKTVGVGDYKKTREYSNTIQLLFFGVGLVMMALVFSLRWLPLSLYQVSGQTRDLAMIMLAIGAVTMVGTTYHAACFTGINRGAGDGKFVFKVDMICGWLIVLPSMYLMAFVLPGLLQGHMPTSSLTTFIVTWQLPLVFLCSRIDQCFKWLIALIRLRGNRWIRNVTRA